MRVLRQKIHFHVEQDKYRNVNLDCTRDRALSVCLRPGTLSSEQTTLNGQLWRHAMCVSERARWQAVIVPNITLLGATDLTLPVGL